MRRHYREAAVIDKQGLIPAPARPTTRAAIVLGVLPVLAFGLLGGSTGHDDSHITFWQAHSLLVDGELLNYNGERLEQSSSLLLVLLTAFAGWLGLPLVTSGYLINLAAALACIVLTGKLADRYGCSRAWVPAVLTGLTPCFAYWAWSGMETSLAALLVVAVIACLCQWQRQPSAGSAFMSLLALTGLGAVRPEMVLLVPVYLALLALAWRRPALLLFALPCALLVLWRFQYFGQWFPNPVYAKGNDPGLAQWLRGWEYTLRLFRHPTGALATGAALLLTLASCRVAWRGRQLPGPLATASGLWVLLYTGFVLASGGDWMKEARFWVPLVAPFWLYLSLQLDGGSPWGRQWPQAMMVTLLLSMPFFILQFNMGLPAWTIRQQLAIAGPEASIFERANREHLRDWPALAVLQRTVRQLQAGRTEPLTLMSKQMGMVNFHLLRQQPGAIRVLDMAGLVDNTLRGCPVFARDGFDAQGLRLNYRKFFERLPEAQRDCAIRAPDIIYDIYGWGETIPLPDYLATQGYTVIFQQTGRVDASPGRNITAQQLIAVRQTLLDSLPPLEPVRVDFSEQFAH